LPLRPRKKILHGIRRPVSRLYSYRDLNSDEGHGHGLTTAATPLLHYVRRPTRCRPAAEADGLLRRHFAAGDDKEVYAALLDRHGPMV
jgi:hypothetical protein